MNYEEFKKNLMAAVEAELESQGIEGITLKNEEIMSPDGMTDRLMVGIPGSNISMAYRLQEIYNDFDGDIESKAETLVEILRSRKRKRMLRVLSPTLTELKRIWFSDSFLVTLLFSARLHINRSQTKWLLL